jgi:glycosyltransferase involved in cell wall biosynthesis
VIRRAPALDAARHLAVAGRYWSRLAIPDRWRSWRWAGVPAALALIREHHPSAIWSTYPIATAHRIAARVARRTGLPWVADFRDPMVEFDRRSGRHFPQDERVRRARLQIEQETVSVARQLVFCTEGARRICLERYPGLAPETVTVMPNGFDEAAFLDAERQRSSCPRGSKRILLHSGTVYRGSDRDPSALLIALRKLRDEGAISPQRLALRFRASGNDEYLRALAAQHGVTEMVELEAALPYREALAEMLAADALLLLQGSTSNPAVPAKLYEYLRAGRPILALVDEEGETAATLRAAGESYQADLVDPRAVESSLRQLLSDLDRSQERISSRLRVAEYSRTHQARRLVELLQGLSG